MRYIGSKAKILNFIDDTISQTFGAIDGATVADLFAGTCSVAEMFKHKNASVITNDYLWFSYALQTARVKLNSEPNCGVSYSRAITELNALQGISGFFFQEYTMEGTAHSKYIRNYFDSANAKKIDAICSKMAEWKQDKIISDDMFFLLSASLVDAITKVSNTAGTYGAFLKIDDQRKFKPLLLQPFEFYDNGLENTAWCTDISQLIDEVRGDILYLDPPYNSRQYPPYYHILETAVLYDSPEIYGITGRRPYQGQLSPFCMKDRAMTAMIDLVRRANFGHIYISYSTDGIMDYVKLCSELKTFGEVECFFKPYKRYKSNGGGTGNEKVKEIIIYVKKR